MIKGSAMRIIVYGAGDNCKYVVRAFKKKQEEVVSIVDSDKNKEGKIIEGIQVQGVLRLLENDYDRIVVSIIKDYDDIKNELINVLRINEDKIVHFMDCTIVSPRNTGSIPCDFEKGLTPNQIHGEMCKHIDEVSPMERFFLTGKHNRSYKWLHYFEIYNRHFEKYIGKDVTILEIGVNRGGSLQIWKEIFGPKAKIIGVDISPDCKQFEDEQIQIFIGDQASREFWTEVKSQIPKLDIIIDDGGHYMEQQIVTFEEMFPWVKDDGVYICEDTGTSYYPEKYGSGLKQDNTFIEYSKNFIDYIHAWASHEDHFKPNEYTKAMCSLHYYFGVLVIEKRIMYPPFDMEICNSESEKYAIPHLFGEI